MIARQMIGRRKPRIATANDGDFRIAIALERTEASAIPQPGARLPIARHRHRGIIDRLMIERVHRRLFTDRRPGVKTTTPPGLRACLGIPHEPRCVSKIALCQEKPEGRIWEYVRGLRRRRGRFSPQPGGTRRFPAPGSSPGLDDAASIAGGPAPAIRAEIGSVAAMTNSQTGSSQTALCCHTRKVQPPV